MKLDAASAFSTPRLDSGSRGITLSSGRVPQRRQAGIMLIECLVYVSVLMVVIGVALASFYEVLSFSRHLRRNADDLARTVKAGERWRADIRQATGPVRLQTADGTTLLDIPVAGGTIHYLVVTNSVWRGTDPNGRVEPVLPAVATSRFIRDAGRHVAWWRWEVELPTRLKAARVTPQFTFAAVAAADATP
ncbi:MAG TPA: hypothetical protein PKM73_01665 [Verrucomicrobiota bacterium]|nr:hypothetical protein [Verrucomicrobiota bacterium]HNU49376.1 hypothetical protein [Verrucomicrobiota bacterium]